MEQKMLDEMRAKFKAKFDEEVKAAKDKYDRALEVIDEFEDMLPKAQPAYEIKSEVEHGTSEQTE